MRKITLKCTQCGKKFKYPFHLVGNEEKKHLCEHCNKFTKIPPYHALFA